jgi:hypothetical protein
MAARSHTSVRLSEALCDLLGRAAPRHGDRAAALRALAILGAAHAGLPIDELRQELGGLLAVSFHPQLHDALIQIYLGESATGERTETDAGAVVPLGHRWGTEVAPTAHARGTEVAPTAHTVRTVNTPLGHAAQLAPPVLRPEGRTEDPFAVGLDV